MRNWLTDAVAAIAILTLVAVAFVTGIADGAWSRATLILIAAVVLAAVVVKQRLAARALRGELAQAVHVDDLSGTLNRNGLDTAVRRECTRATRLRQHLSIVLCGIDDYGAIAGGHGAEARDEVVTRIGNLLRSSAREIDIVGRAADDRFAIVLPATPLESAHVVAERMRQAITRWTPAGAVHVTASFGVAGLEEQRDLWDDAERALAEARTLGRDMIVLAGEGDGDLAS